MTERTNDDLNTPEWILDIVRQMGPIGLDPCSNPWSTVGATVSYSLHDGQDGLAVRWDHPGNLWCNPPYSKPKPWAIKIAHWSIWESTLTQHGFCLVKTAQSTAWWETLMEEASARVDFHKRITFEGGAHKSGMMDSTMFYFGPHPYLFCHLFAPHGEVRVYR